MPLWGRRLAADWRGWIASLLTAVCVVYLVVNTNLTELQRAAEQTDYRLLSLALVISALTVVAKGLRWWALYPAWARPSPALAVAGVAVGQVANWAAPFRMGEVIRVGLASASRSSNRGRSLAAGVGVLVAEKLVDTVLLLVTVAVLVVLVGVPSWLSTSAVLLALIGCAIGLALVLWLRRRSWAEWSSLGRRWLARWLPARAAWLLEDATGLGEGLSAWLSLRLGVQVLAWSLLAWALGAVVNYVVSKSVAAEPHQALAASLAILAALYGAAAIPTLPGRVGVFQYVCVMTLGPFGVGFEQALFFSLALYLAVYVPPMTIGLVSMLFLSTPPWGRLGARLGRRQV